MTRFCLVAAGWLAALSAPVAALDLVSPPVLFAGESLRLRWTTGDGRLTAHLAGPPDTVLVSGYRAATGEWSVVPPAGAWQLSATVAGPRGEVLETGNWRLMVLDQPAVPAAVVDARLPHLAGALRAHGRARLAVAASPRFEQQRPGLAGLLAAVATRAGGGTVTLATPPERPDADLTPLGVLDGWLAATRADAVLLEAARCAPAAPPHVVGARVAALARAAGQADLVVLGPPPAEATPEAVLRAVDAAAAIAAACPQAVVLSGAAAVLPATRWDLPDLGPALRLLIEADGTLPPAGHRQAGAALLAALSPPPPPVDWSAALATAAAGGPELRLSATSRVETEQRVHVAVLRPCPAGEPQFLVVDLPPGGATTVACPVPAGQRPTDVVLANLLIPGRQAQLCHLPVVAGDLEARPATGRHLIGAEAALPLLLRDRTGRSRMVTVAAGAGQPAGVVRLGHGATATVPVPLLLPAARRGRLAVGALVTDGDTTQAVDTAVRYARAASLSPRAVALDGRLDDWADQVWYAIGQPDQVTAGRDAWSGPADAVARWAAGLGDDGLLLALTVADDHATATDRLTLLWDSRPPAEVGGPGLPRRLILSLNDGTLSGAEKGQARTATVGEPGCRAVEVWLSWSLLGRRPAAGEPLGWDLVLHDADPGQPEAQLTDSGEPWSPWDPGRLGLLVVGPSGPPLTRLLVEVD